MRQHVPSPTPRRTLRSVTLLAVVSIWFAACASATEPAPELLIRADDIGMNHTVNTALKEFIRSGVPFSASVMVPCPWFAEAATILRDNPQVGVGIHLTLNSEWADYRWGPVLGASAVPSLVDDNGYFFHTGAELLANGMDLDEVRAELRAQVRRALNAGLDVVYLDYHMLTAVSTPELRAVVEELAAEFDVGLSRYFGEVSVSLWDVEPERKLVVLLDAVTRARPGTPTLVVMHLGLDTPEMNALIDANNPADPYRVAKHRAAELDALTSPAFLRAAAERNIRFVTYADLVERYGVRNMQAPQEFAYSLGEE
jgi:chitin disaccharide deacetylase